ncbi:MAG: hypothetical protein ACMG6S_37490, partial [Byssovorax sp.]
MGATTRTDGRPRAPRKAAGIDLALAAITAAHKAAGLDSPRDAAGVRAVRRGIRRELGTAPREAAPLLTPELRRAVAALPATLHGARDRALLLLGWAGGFRRSALVSLDVTDLLFSPAEGIAVTLRRDKTDQGREEEGPARLCRPELVPGPEDPAQGGARRADTCSCVLVYQVRGERLRTVDREAGMIVRFGALGALCALGILLAGPPARAAAPPAPALAPAPPPRAVRLDYVRGPGAERCP